VLLPSTRAFPVSENEAYLLTFVVMRSSASTFILDQEILPVCLHALTLGWFGSKDVTSFQGLADVLELHSHMEQHTPPPSQNIFPPGKSCIRLQRLIVLLASIDSR
jgi:hypothetical protein